MFKLSPANNKLALLRKKNLFISKEDFEKLSHGESVSDWLVRVEVLLH